jgi:hypothetical protein
LVWAFIKWSHSSRLSKYHPHCLCWCCLVCVITNFVSSWYSHLHNDLLLSFATQLYDLNLVLSSWLFVIQYWDGFPSTKQFSPLFCYSKSIIYTFLFIITTLSLHKDLTQFRNIIIYLFFLDSNVPFQQWYRLPSTSFLRFCNN